MTWTPPIDRLAIPIRVTVTRALKKLGADPAEADGLLRRLALDVWRTAVRTEKDRQAKAAETPRERALRKQLVELTATTDAFIARLDELMVQPATVERGRAVAHARNALGFANDLARHFGLGVKLKKLGGARSREGGELLRDVLAFVRDVAEGHHHDEKAHREHGTCCVCDAEKLWARLRLEDG